MFASTPSNAALAAQVSLITGLNVTPKAAGQARYIRKTETA